MNLELFDFIEDTLSYFERKNPSYVYAQGRILETYSQLYPSENTAVIHLHTRIKSKDSNSFGIKSDFSCLMEHGGVLEHFFIFAIK